MRSGRYVKQIEGYSAFIPSPLPPDPPIRIDDPELIHLLSDADRALAIWLSRYLSLFYQGFWVKDPPGYSIPWRVNSDLSKQKQEKSA
jgi:hypothetical protein